MVSKKRRWFWRANSQNKIRFDLFIIILAIINWFQIPYVLAFVDLDEQILWLDILNGLIDLWFMLDVLINFRTSYVDESTGNEISNMRLIAIQYLKGKFWIDLLASLPLDFISYAFDNSDNDNTIILQLFGLLKLVRILRLSRLIAYMNLNNELKMSLKLIKLLFFLILYLHCLGCLWFFIVKQNEIWIPPLDYIYLKTGLFGESQLYQYSLSIYHALLILGINDIGPRNTFQMIFICVMLIVSAIINASIFGNMTVLLQSLNHKASNFQK